MEQQDPCGKMVQTIRVLKIVATCLFAKVRARDLLAKPSNAAKDNNSLCTGNKIISSGNESFIGQG